MKHICEKCGKAFDDSFECRDHEKLCGLKEEEKVNVKCICFYYSDFSISESERLEERKYALGHLDLGRVQYDVGMMWIYYDESKMTRQEAFRKILNPLEREYNVKKDQHRMVLKNYKMIKKLATQNTEDAKND